MIPLVLFILLGLVILVLFEWRARKRGALSSTERDGQPLERKADGECCGQHLVCERELPPLDTPVYYDDEELDSLAGIPAAQYSKQQADLVREVFSTLRQEDVVGWVRSLQMRNIELPPDVREEALLLVREYRANVR